MVSVPDVCSLSSCTWLTVWYTGTLCEKVIFAYLTFGLPLVKLTGPFVREDLVKLTGPFVREDIFTEVRRLFQKLHWTHCTVSVHFDFNELSDPGNKRFHTVIYWIFTQLLTLVLFGKCFVQIWADCSFVDIFQSRQASYCKSSHGCSFAYPCILPSQHSTVWPDLQTALTWITNRQHNQPNTWQSRNSSYYFLALLSVHFW